MRPAEAPRIFRRGLLWLRGQRRGQHTGPRVTGQSDSSLFLLSGGLWAVNGYVFYEWSRAKHQLFASQNRDSSACDFMLQHYVCSWRTVCDLEQWWCVLTAIVSHENAMHFAVNTIAGASFLRGVAPVAGRMTSVATYVAGGVVSNLAWLVLHAPMAPAQAVPVLTQALQHSIAFSGAQAMAVVTGGAPPHKPNYRSGSVSKRDGLLSTWWPRSVFLPQEQNQAALEQHWGAPVASYDSQGRFSVKVVGPLASGQRPASLALGGSGGVYAVAALFAVLRPHSLLAFMFVLPVRAGRLLLADVAVESLLWWRGAEPYTGVAHSAHVAGALSGMSVGLLLRVLRR